METRATAPPTPLANATELYGRTIDCACGRRHRIEPNEVLYQREAAEQMPYLLNRQTTGDRVAILMDRRTRVVAGTGIAAELAACDWKASTVLVPDTATGNRPVCSAATKGILEASIGEADVFVAVGSGVINDLTKWIAFERGAPYICFATAASMNGYTSANVAPTVNGVKQIAYARPPLAVAADPALLQAAPREMTSAGLGDILAKSVSSTDWLLNHLLFEDYYCPRSVALIEDLEPLYLEHPEALAAGNGEAVAALFHGLLLTGVAMTMVGTSAPASGAEHLISHTLDMLSALDGHPHDLHGRQVGVGTILASALYRRVLACENPTFRIPEGGVDSGVWGSLSKVIEQHGAEKAERVARAAERLQDGLNWDALRSALARQVRPPEQVRGVLAAAGAAHTAADIGCDRPRLRTALRHAHTIRSRFTVLDLARLIGVLPEAAEELVETWG